MSSHTILKFIVGHVLAGAVVIFGTLLVALVCYIIGLARAAHGIDTPAAEIPFFLTLMCMAGLFALIASTGSFLVSTLLTWLRAKRHFPAWVPVVAIPLMTFGFVLPVFGRSKGLDFVAVVTGAVFIYFGIYWALLMSSAAFLDFFRRKFSRHTAA